MMKAAIFRGVGQPLSIETVADPVPGPRKVVVKIGRCGICGTDLHMTSGQGMNYPLGTISGREFSGEVVALGADVERIRIGDIVAAQRLTGCGKCVDCLAGEPKHCQQMLGIGSTSMNCVGRRGTVVVLGFCSVADRIGPSDFLFREIELACSNTYSTREFEICADALGSGSLPSCPRRQTRRRGVTVIPLFS